MHETICATILTGERHSLDSHIVHGVIMPYVSYWFSGAWKKHRDPGLNRRLNIMWHLAEKQLDASPMNNVLS